MSYTVRNDVPLKPLVRDIQLPGQTVQVTDDAQAVFELDDGDLVAMNYTCKRIVETNTLSCRIVAWLVDIDGDPQGVDPDAAGPEPQTAICVEFKHNAHAVQLNQLSSSGLAAALRDLVLGEPATDPPAIPWSPEIRDQANIRYAISTARATGDVVDLTTATVVPVPPLVVP